MNLDNLNAQFDKYKEQKLSHRYITNDHIEPLLQSIKKDVNLQVIGYSVLNSPIYGLKIGSGKKRILMWSQMHGNETTTTKALFDLLNTLLADDSEFDYILQSCTLYIIPMLNPDGAKAFTRVNANDVDLNRDAQNLTQPESKILRKVFNDFKPDFCYNLHGQRTIFSVGKTNNVATVSFLSPAQDEACTITPNRKCAMEVIAVMNNVLQEIIPNQVGVYDDAFNLNCVGDTFQSENVPTILFEAGHYKNDYGREFTRRLIYISYLTSFDYIANADITGAYYESYFNIPENEKWFYDIIIRNTNVGDIGILYQEKLVDGKILFSPKIIAIEDLGDYYGHKEIDIQNQKVTNFNGENLKIDEEIDFVIVNDKKISLLLV